MALRIWLVYRYLEDIAYVTYTATLVRTQLISIVSKVLCQRKDASGDVAGRVTSVGLDVSVSGVGENIHVRATRGRKNVTLPFSYSSPPTCVHRVLLILRTA